jgi:pilus assembly protein CpaF
LSDPTVSRRHALLSYRDGRWQLRDLGALNGTYVNGARVIDATEVRSADEVCFAAAAFA